MSAFVMSAFGRRPSAFEHAKNVAAGLCPAVILVCAMLLAWAPTHTQPLPDTARVGPLEASVGRNAFGACQIRLRNIGAVAIEGWRVSVRSEVARHVTIEAHDGWRDAFHLPLEASQIEPGELITRPVPEAGTAGPLTVRVHLVVRADGLAHGMVESEAYSGDGAHELERLLAARRPAADEALAAATAMERAITAHGADRVLAEKRLSTFLEQRGDWNWWQVRQQALAAEALPAGDPRAAAQLQATLARLHEAHRRGTGRIALVTTVPMSPRATGDCNP